jgi:hypothetical protein
MVLAAPGPLLTPPPSAAPSKPPHGAYSAHTRAQEAQTHPSPKQYLPPQTRTRHRRAHRPHVPTPMRGNTPPTTRSPPHLSRLTGNPPNLQPVTVSEEERGHDTFPANNNRPEERRTSCRQQPAPPPSDAAKMSPRISIGPEPVLAAHAPSPPAAGSHCPASEGSAPH